MKIAIIGTGNMATAIAERLLAAGRDVNLVSRDPGAATQTVNSLDAAAELANATVGHIDDPLSADVVFLAVPFGAALEYVREHAEHLSGKIIVDISNPIDFETFQMITPPVKSAAQYLAEAAPDGTPIVKAFNTTFGSAVRSGAIGGQKVTVFLAGDSDDAKTVIGGLVVEMGLESIDLGDLDASRALEAFQFLHIKAQDTLGTEFGSAIAILRPAS